jgi:hypothetical protein
VRRARKSPAGPQPSLTTAGNPNFRLAFPRHISTSQLAGRTFTTCWKGWLSCNDRMSRRAFSLCFVAASMLPAIAFSQSFLSQYKGLPYYITTAAIRAAHKKYRDEYCVLTTTLGRALSSANHYFVQSSTFRCLIRLNATSLDMRVSPIERAWAAIIMSMLPKSCPRRSSPTRRSP